MTGGPLETSWWTFPLPSRNYEWNVNELNEYDDFVAVIFYEVTIYYGDNSHEVQHLDRDIYHVTTEDPSVISEVNHVS